jgi:hypothetical protein
MKNSVYYGQLEIDQMEIDSKLSTLLEFSGKFSESDFRIRSFTPYTQMPRETFVLQHQTEVDDIVTRNILGKSYKYLLISRKLAQRCDFR